MYQLERVIEDLDLKLKAHGQPGHSYSSPLNVIVAVALQSIGALTMSLQSPIYRSIHHVLNPELPASSERSALVLSPISEQQRK